MILSRRGVRCSIRDVISVLASSAALPIPTIAGMLSVPGLRPPSCAPPLIMETISVPSFTYKAAMPFGP